MSDESRQTVAKTSDTEQWDLGGELLGLVTSVQEFGERAKLMAVNLAVVVAKLRQTDRRVARLNEDILDLVARITKASNDVADIVTAIQGERPASSASSGGVLGVMRQAGIPDERVLDRLDRSLGEIVELSQRVLEWMSEAQRLSGLYDRDDA